MWKAEGYQRKSTWIQNLKTVRVIFSFNFHLLSTAFSAFLHRSSPTLQTNTSMVSLKVRVSLSNFHYSNLFLSIISLPNFLTILLSFFVRFSPSILSLNPNSCLVLACFRENPEWAQLEPLWSVLPSLAQAVYMCLFDFFFCYCLVF